MTEKHRLIVQNIHVYIENNQKYVDIAADQFYRPNMVDNSCSPSGWGIARMAFIAAIPEIARRLAAGEPGKRVWSSIFAPPGQPPKMSYTHYTKLVRKRLPEFSQAGVRSLKYGIPTSPAPAPAKPLNYDPAISGTGPRPLPPPLPKMPDVIRPGPMRSPSSSSDTGPVPGSTEWKKLHGIETSTGRRNLIEQRVPDGRYSGDEN